MLIPWTGLRRVAFLNPGEVERARVEDVVVAVRQRYCNPASTSAVPEIPSSAAWTMRKMKTAAAAANAIRNRGK
jgi:hypothetical protein